MELMETSGGIMTRGLTTHDGTKDKESLTTIRSAMQVWRGMQMDQALRGRWRRLDERR